MAGAAAASDTTGYQWVKMDSNGWLPTNALAAGKDGSETCNVYVGRSEVDGETCVGKVHMGIRYFKYGRQERRVDSEPFSILCVDPDAEIKWVEYGEEGIPAVVVLGGTLSGGEPLYVGRGMVEKMLTPGMIYANDEPYKLTALYGGKARQAEQFQLLVVNPQLAR